MRAPRFGRPHSLPLWLSLLAIPLVLWPGLVHGSGDFAAPTPSMIDQLRQQYSANDWLHVTVEANRLELRVERIENDGLHGLRPRKRTTLPPMLPWSSIESIDRRESRVVTGRWLGLVVGVIAGAWIGGSQPYGPQDPDGDGVYENPKGLHPAWKGILVGGVAGPWLGGRLGDRVAHYNPLYIARPSGSPSEQATTPTDVVTTTPAPAEAWVPKVRTRVKPGQLMRVTGDFGQFSGRAAEITDQGLSGLLPDPAFVSTIPLPSEPISWATISRVERRGNRSTGFAVVGGLALGVSLGFMSAGMTEWLGPSTTEQKTGAFAGGFLVGGLIGGGVGALIGAAVPRWQRVHP